MCDGTTKYFCDQILLKKCLTDDTSECKEVLFTTDLISQLELWDNFDQEEEFWACLRALT